MWILEFLGFWRMVVVKGFIKSYLKALHHFSQTGHSADMWHQSLRVREITCRRCCHTFFRDPAWNKRIVYDNHGNWKAN